MTRACSILLVDSNPDDRALAALVLQRELPRATLVAVADAMALGEALSSFAPEVAVIAAGQVWARHEDIVAAIRRGNPTAAVVLFGHDADIIARVLNPGLTCDGLVCKTSAGFLRLAPIVVEVLERVRSAPVPAVVTSMPVSLATERGRQEMRDVAMAFSHDLREPLQQIERLADFGQTNGDGTGETLTRVRECAARAGAMLDGMLNYLSVATRDASPAAVDLNACLTRALDNLRGAAEEARAEISSGPLPTTVGDEYQLLHLFQNLLSNAIKFRGTEAPRIHIAAERQGRQWLLRFRDNGIGVAAPFAERIFEMGQRLHTREEFPGLGIGLALCRRIAERHGGQIWVESGDGNGSTFCVVLPGARDA